MFAPDNFNLANMYVLCDSASRRGLLNDDNSFLGSAELSRIRGLAVGGLSQRPTHSAGPAVVQERRRRISNGLSFFLSLHQPK
jgi:hypothetical protein